MKKILPVIVLFVFVAVYVFGQSIWEGSVAVSRYGDFPQTGYYAASNAFDRNSIVKVTNITNGKSIEVIVVSRLDDPGLFMLLSPEAGNALAIPQGEVVQVKASPGSRQGQLLSNLHQDNIRDPDPDANPETTIPSEFLEDDPQVTVVPTPTPAPSEDITQVKPTPRPTPEKQITEVKPTPTPGADERPRIVQTDVPEEETTDEPTQHIEPAASDESPNAVTGMDSPHTPDTPDEDKLVVYPDDIEVAVAKTDTPETGDETEQPDSVMTGTQDPLKEAEDKLAARDPGKDTDLPPRENSMFALDAEEQTIEDEGPQVVTEVIQDAEAEEEQIADADISPREGEAETPLVHDGDFDGQPEEEDGVIASAEPELHEEEGPARTAGDEEAMRIVENSDLPQSESESDSVASIEPDVPEDPEAAVEDSPRVVDNSTLPEEDDETREITSGEPRLSEETELAQTDENQEEEPDTTTQDDTPVIVDGKKRPSPGREGDGVVAKQQPDTADEEQPEAITYDPPGEPATDEDQAIAALEPDMDDEDLEKPDVIHSTDAIDLAMELPEDTASAGPPETDSQTPAVIESPEDTKIAKSEEGTPKAAQEVPAESTDEEKVITSRPREVNEPDTTITGPDVDKSTLVQLVPAEERPPKYRGKDSYEDPSKTQKKAVSTIPEKIEGYDVISTLENSYWYLQIGAYKNQKLVSKAAAGIQTPYPVKIMPVTVNSKSWYRLIVGPVGEDESGALYVHLKNMGFEQIIIHEGS